jgi:hypothetical protein
MNDPLPTTTTNEPLAYQPVSGWAVAGCIAAGLFALLVVMSAIVGVFQGAPVFFYQWIVVLPIAAVVLCLIGRHQVDNSEGTRTGAKLARVGLWLAVVSSVTYFSYYYVTRWAVENQADAFLREKTDDAGFFPRLVEGGKDNTQLNLAFLLTKPRNDRTGNPESNADMRSIHDRGSVDGAPALWLQFRESPFGRVFYKDLAKDAVITPLAVEDWDYKEKSHKVYRVYRIKTKEIEAMDVRIAVASMEPEAPGQTRKWFVNLNETRYSGSPGFAGMKKLTPLGENVARLRQSAIEWLDGQIGKWRSGEPVADITDLDKTVWEELLDEDGKLKGRRDFVRGVLGEARKDRIAVAKIYTRGDDPGRWEQVNARVRIELFVHLMLVRPEPAGTPPVNVIADFTIESLREVNPASLDQLPDWKLHSFNIMTAAQYSEKKN